MNRRNNIFTVASYHKYLHIANKRFISEFKKTAEPTYTRNDIEIKMTLGNGSYGKVVLGILKNTDKQYAIKILEKKEIVKRNAIENSQNEKNILQAIDNPFVTRMEFYFTDNSYIYFVLPYMSGGDVFTLIRRMTSLSELHSKFYAIQVCLALEYLHSLNLIHRDIKPENILIDEGGYIKVADFGICKLVSGRTYTFCGTPEYIAPEIVLHKGYGSGVDWWSFGVLIYEMNAGYLPFHNNDIFILYETITSGRYRCPTHFTSDLVDLVSNVLQVDLSRRYGNLTNGSNDIKNHNWFKDINWLAVLNRQYTVPYKPSSKDVLDGWHFKKLEQFIPTSTSKNLYKKEFENF